MVKKVIILVCVISIGLLFESFTPDSEKVNERQLKQLEILLTPTMY